MRVAALYDIHGNLSALEAVISELDHDPPDAIVVGGDVLWGPLQAECIALLEARDARFLAGNCERDVRVGDSVADRWCREQLSPELLDEVSRWPDTIELDVPSLGHILFCHATPRSNEEILTRLTPADAIAEAIGDVEADVVVGGHTHVQVDRRIPGAPRLVNPGSVGLAYEGRPGAYWAMLGRDVELRATPYPVEPALDLLRSRAFPGFDDVFSNAIRGEVTADSASENLEARRRGA